MPLSCDHLQEFQNVAPVAKMKMKKTPPKKAKGLAAILEKLPKKNPVELLIRSEERDCILL